MHRHLQNKVLYARRPLCVSLLIDITEELNYVGQEIMLHGKDNNVQICASVLLIYESWIPFRMIQVMCWSGEKKLRGTDGVTSFKVTVIEEVGSGFEIESLWVVTLICIWTMLGNLTTVRYRDKILASYVTTYVGARGDKFILMDNNVRSRRD